MQELKEHGQTFEAQTHNVIKQIIGAYPAVFLHSSLPDEAVDRFINLQLWFRNQPHTIDAYRALLHEMRRDFWNTQALSMLDNRSTLERIQHLLPKRSKTQQADTSPMEERIELAQIARENLERLQGFELELREMRLASIAQWETPITDDSLEALIVDREALERLAG